jgi:hypothetical protein
MEENKLRFEGRQSLWDQVVRNQSGDPLETRTITLRHNVHQAVEDYADFCERKRGDRYTSVLSAVKEIRNESRELMEKVDEATDEQEVEAYGVQLNKVIGLYKALEAYYVNYLLPPGTGTSGD